MYMFVPICVHMYLSCVFPFTYMPLECPCICTIFLNIKSFLRVVCKSVCSFFTLKMVCLDIAYFNAANCDHNSYSVGAAFHNLGKFYLAQRKLEEARICYEVTAHLHLSFITFVLVYMHLVIQCSSFVGYLNNTVLNPSFFFSYFSL